jgi:hypothetical protein
MDRGERISPLREGEKYGIADLDQPQCHRQGSRDPGNKADCRGNAVGLARPPWPAVPGKGS